MHQYDLLKNVHLGLALVSVAGFVLRWIWVMANSPRSQLRITRTLPHIIDTLFLATGVALVFTIDQFPFQAPWLTAKVSGLVVYIVLGSFAIKRARSSPGRILAFIAALGTFAWIGSVARLKSPWGYISSLL